VEGNSIDSVMDQLLDEEKDFFKFLDEQLQMVDHFYKGSNGLGVDRNRLQLFSCAISDHFPGNIKIIIEKELEAVTKLKVIKQQLYVASEWKRLYDERMVRTKL